MILIIDDDRKRLEPLSDFLKDFDYDVKIIDGPGEVPQFLQQKSEEIDLIILDILMPDEGTIEELEKKSFQIKDSSKETGLLLYDYIKEKFSSIPVMVHSVIRDEGLATSIRKNGSTYISKPAGAATIVEEVKKILEDK